MPTERSGEPGFPPSISVFEGIHLYTLALLGSDIDRAGCTVAVILQANQEALKTAVRSLCRVQTEQGFHLGLTHYKLHVFLAFRPKNSPVLFASYGFHSSRSRGRGPMRWEDRIENYAKETGFPKCLFVGPDGRVVGTWIMGNDYRVKSTYYGGYPAGYLRRVRALFPDKRRTLHLFSGQVDQAAFPGDTVDINPALKPTFVDDAQTLERVPLEQYDLVLADPPYSVEDADHYQTTMIKRNVVMRALQRLPVEAHVVWLDQVLPMYRKDAFEQEAAIGMWKSTNHRFRGITIFRRRDAKVSNNVAAASERRSKASTRSRELTLAGF